MKITKEQQEKMKVLHALGLTNRAIAKDLNLHHSSINTHIKSFGLRSNGNKLVKIEFITPTTAKCSKCKEIVDIGQFQKNRKGQKYEYYFSYCNTCRKKQSYLNINSTIEKYLGQKFSRLKRKCLNLNVPFDLEKDTLLQLFYLQNRVCFYTGQEMDYTAGTGLKPNSLSVDKMIPEKGYTKNNIVLCMNKINTLKSNLTLKELEMWMPLFYNKIIEKLQTP